jgi:tetratricopeptide (TPR) repeat protein
MSNLLSDKKKAENIKLADAALKKAHEATKKTFLRWKPDWELAARHYREAVKYYKGSGLPSVLVQVSRESAVAHDEIGQYLEGAMNLEIAAGILAKGEGDVKTDRKLAYELYRESSIMFRKANSFDRSAGMLIKAAEAMEPENASSTAGVPIITNLDSAANENISLGIEALKEACSIFEDEQRIAFHEATFKKAITYCLKYNHLDECIEFLHRQNEMYKQQLTTFETDLYKNYLCEILLYMYQNSLDEANDCLQRYQNNEKFITTEHFEAAQNLITAFEDGDEEKLKTAKNHNALKYILNPVAILTRKFTISNDRPRVRKPKSTAAGVGKNVEAEVKDEDDFT